MPPKAPDATPRIPTESGAKTVAIRLGGGNRKLVALVDAEDAGLISRYRWSLKRVGKLRYAQAWVSGRTVRMHRLILNAAAGQIVDHVDGDGLNNSRENLRLCTASQNNQNRRALRGAFKGVHRFRCHRWRAMIKRGGQVLSLGVYATPESAARAYDAAAREHFGAFARLNFPRPGEQPALRQPKRGRAAR